MKKQMFDNNEMETMKNVFTCLCGIPYSDLEKVMKARLIDDMYILKRKVCNIVDGEEV